MASWYTRESQPVDADRILSDLELGESFNDLTIRNWKDPDELTDVLSEEMAKKLKLRSASDIEGFKDKEIAEILSVSPGAAKIRLHRARAKLKTALEQTCTFQRDERNEYPHVLQAFEGLLLDWSEATVRLEARDVPRLPRILRALAANASALSAKRLALARLWTRLLWREALPQDVARTLRGAPDAFDSLMQTLSLRMRYGLDGRTPSPRP